MAIVLIQVVRRSDLSGLLPLVELEVDRLDHESNVYLEDRVKRSYLSDIDKRIKFEPSVRSTLANEDWCIDACVSGS